MRPVHRDACIISLKIAVALSIEKAHVVVRPVEAGLDLVLRVAPFGREVLDRNILAFG